MGRAYSEMIRFVDEQLAKDAFVIAPISTESPISIASIHAAGRAYLPLFPPLGQPNFALIVDLIPTVGASQ